MIAHNVPEASDKNTFAEIGKSKIFIEYHGISCLRGRKWGRKIKCRGYEIFCGILVFARYTEMSELDPIHMVELEVIQANI